MKSSLNRNQILYQAISAILIVFSGVERFWIFNRSEFPSGWDSYYYIMKAFSIIENGEVKCFELSFTYPVYTSLAYLIGDYILAFKCFVALLTILFTFSVFLLVRNWRDDYWTGWVAVAICVFSPTLTYFAGQFPKNLLGVSLLLLGLAFIVKRKTVPAAVSIGLSILSHRMTAALGLLVVIYQGVRKIKWQWLAGLGVLLIVASLLFPGVLHYSDLQRFSGGMKAPDTIAPIAFMEVIQLKHMPYYWLYELLIIYGVVLFFIMRNVLMWVQKKQVATIEILLMILLLVLGFPFLEINTGSMGFRFYLGFSLIGLVTIPFFISYLGRIYKIQFFGVFLILGWLAFYAYKNEDFDAPYGLYQSVSEEAKKELEIRDIKPEKVIAHNALADVFFVETSINSSNWPNEDSLIANKDIWRITCNISRMDYREYLSEKDQSWIYNLTPAYFIVREDIWTKFYLEVENADDQNLLKKIKEFNPVRQKPDYLKKGRDE